MDFRIADTFTDSLARLTGDEQKAVKTTAFDLQLNPASPGLKFHRIDRAKDPNFWSLRVNADIRLIVKGDDMGAAQAINEELELLATLGIIDESGRLLAADLPPRLRRVCRPSLRCGSRGSASCAGARRC